MSPPDARNAPASGPNTGQPYRSYLYDLAGNQMMSCSGTITGSTCSGESLSYIYDGKDQLRRATKRDSSGNILGSEEYWYDGRGTRVTTLKRDSAGNKTELIWWIGDAEAHYDATGTVTHIYTHISLGTAVARVDRTSNTATSLEYQFHGLETSTLAAVDQSGTVNASMSYAPFGEIIEATDGTGIELAEHRRRLNDKFKDEISTL